MSLSISQAADLIQTVRREIQKVLIGQEEVLDHVLAALAASGHVLVEGLPGLGKTLLVRALGQTFSGKTQRVQFTPDLMPSDLIGHSVYDMQSGKFTTRKGPVFTHLLVADEINRAPAKTQAALLEVMQEYQVSFDGETHQLERPFLVMATQNPLEHEGTYPLPDAQLDRFLLKIQVTYPPFEDEVKLVSNNLESKRGDVLDIKKVQQVTDLDSLRQVQDTCCGIQAVPQVVEYAVKLVAETRKSSFIHSGAGPRASMALVRLARARALMAGRDFITPGDIKSIAAAVLQHRITLDPEWELDGGTATSAIDRIVQTVETPRE